MDISDIIEQRIAEATEHLGRREFSDAAAVIDDALEVAGRHNYQHGTAMILNAKGRLKAELHRYTEAQKCLSDALDVFLDIADAAGISQSLLGLGNVAVAQGNTAGALEYFLAGYGTLGMSGDERHTMGLLNNICVSYRNLGDYAVAAEYANVYRATAVAHNSEANICTAQLLLGNICLRCDDYPSGLELFLDTAARAKRTGNSVAERQATGYIGVAYAALANSSAALHYHLEALDMSETSGDVRHQATCCHYLSECYLQMNNPSFALQYAMKSLGVFETLGDRQAQAYSLENIAEIFLALGDNDSAQAYAGKSLELHEAAEIKHGKTRTLLTLAAISAVKSDHNEAIALARRALTLAEELNNALQLRALEFLENQLLATGDAKAAAECSRRRSTVKKLLRQEERTAKAAQMLAEAELRRVRQRAAAMAEQHAGSPSLASELFVKTTALDARGFSLSPRSAAPPKSARRVISVATFGRFSVEIDGKELTADDWQRKKAREIFKILLLNYRKSLSIEEIIEMAWPDAAGKNLTPTLWNAVSFVRKALEPDIKPFMPSSYITIVDKSYALDLGDGARIDFLEFQNLTAEAAKETDERKKRQIYERKIALYAGDFLKEDTGAEWAAHPRETMKEEFLDAAAWVAANHLDYGNLPAAITFARKALAADRTFDEAYRILFTALGDFGQAGELAEAWKSCQAAYRKELGSRPPAFLERLAVV